MDKKNLMEPSVIEDLPLSVLEGIYEDMVEREKELVEARINIQVVVDDPDYPYDIRKANNMGGNDLEYYDYMMTYLAIRYEIEGRKEK